MEPPEVRAAMKIPVMPYVAHHRGKWRRTWEYWTFGAEVYPDGIVNRWSKKHTAHGYVTIDPLDDHMNADGRVWNGHSQGHCGEHIYVVGTDRNAVRLAREQHVKEALSRQDGACHSATSHHGDIDGRTILAAGSWGEVRRAGSKEVLKMDCLYHFDHDWSEWSAPHGEQENRSRSCKRCAAFEFTVAVKIGIGLSVDTLTQ